MKRGLVDEAEPSRPSKLRTNQRDSCSSSDDDVIVLVDVDVDVNVEPMSMLTLAWGLAKCALEWFVSYKFFFNLGTDTRNQLVNLPFKLRTEHSQLSHPLSVKIASDNSTILLQDTDETFADLTPASSKILGVLSKKPQLSIQLYVAPSISLPEASIAKNEHKIFTLQPTLGVYHGGGQRSL
jgi:hypothetical protein